MTDPCLKLLDHVAATGEALEVERRGVVLRIAPRDRPSLAALFPPQAGLITGNPDDLPEVDGSGLWSPTLP